MRLIGLEREVFVLEVGELAARGIEPHARERTWRARELLARLLEVIQIQVGVAERAALVGPFVPDADAALLEPSYVGVAAQEPQQLVEDRLEVQLLRREQREALVEREAQLPSEHRQRAGAGAIGLARAVLEHFLQQIEIVALAHSMIVAQRSEALWKRSSGCLASSLSSSGWCAASASGSFGGGAVTCMRMRPAGAG